MNIVRDSLGGYIATTSAKVGGHLHGSHLAGHGAPMPGYDLSTGGLKRERVDSGGEGGHSSEEEMADFSDTGPRKGKKTKGRVKIKMEFIDNKLRRYTTFSKRKTGIMKKAYELSTLTGTQVMLLVASETGHVYTFATRKLQPMITSEAGKALIQTCLNSPDPPEEEGGSGHAEGENQDHRMSATGYEETDLSYHVQDEDASGGEDVPLEDPLPAPPSTSPPVMTIPPLVLAQLLKTGNFTVDNKNNLVSTASLQPVPLDQHNLPDAPPIAQSGPLNLQTRVSPSASPPSTLDPPAISSYTPPSRLPTNEIKFGRKPSSVMPSNLLVPNPPKLVAPGGLLREEGVSLGQQQLASGKSMPRILKKVPLDLVTMSNVDPCQIRDGGNLVRDRDQGVTQPLERNFTTAMPLLSKAPITSSDQGASRTIIPSFMTSMADLQSFITMSGQARAEPTSSPSFPQNLSMPKKK